MLERRKKPGLILMKTDGGTISQKIITGFRVDLLEDEREKKPAKKAPDQKLLSEAEGFAGQLLSNYSSQLQSVLKDLKEKHQNCDAVKKLEQRLVACCEGPGKDSKLYETTLNEMNHWSGELVALANKEKWEDTTARSARSLTSAVLILARIRLYLAIGEFEKAYGEFGKIPEAENKRSEAEKTLMKEDMFASSLSSKLVRLA